MSFKVDINQKTTEELLDVYNKADEYQEDFVKMVGAELQKRGVNTTIYEKKIAEKEIIADEKIRNGEKGDPAYIIIGFISAFFGGIIGIAAGAVYSFSKRTDSQGNKHYYYNLETRKKGHQIFFIGMVVFLAVLALKIGI